MRLVIIANPRSGGGRTYAAVARRLRDWPYRGWDVELLRTRGPGHAGILAAGLLADPPDVLAICGGDGTLNEVVTRVPAPPFPVALVPAGTANVLAREMALHLDPHLALETALTGRIKRLDTGMMNGSAERRFLLMAGVGFDAAVVAGVPLALKNRVGRGAFVITAVRKAVTYPFPEFQVTTDQGTQCASTCIVANSSRYGGGFVLSPGANMCDGLLDVVAIQGRSPGQYLRFWLSIQKGGRQEFPWVQRIRTRTVRIAGGRDVLIQVDGEIAGGLPVDIGVDPCSFPLVVPR
jgi:diacylglycerol kinase (ATP)